MSVLKGEGDTVILYGETSVSTGASSYHGYLARPDLRGEWPTVVVTAPADTESTVADICRSLARNGIAAVAPGAGGLDSFVDFITNPAGHWSNAEHGFGTLGLGDGAADAASAGVVGVALVGPVIDDPLLIALRGARVPILVCSARVDGIDQARRAAPHAEWVVYDGVEPDFWDVAAEGYSPTAAGDAGERVTEFFAGLLPARL